MAAKSKKKRSPVKRKKTVVKKREQLMEMTINDQTYSVGTAGWYVDERSHLSRPKALRGEITDVYPNDSIEPAVGVRDSDGGKHRAIRARLVGRSKKEAMANYEAFVTSQGSKEK
jgi:hypothetical protein